MWIDEQGVCNTVALPDPTVLMSADFRDSLDRLLATSSIEVVEVVESEEATFLSHRSQVKGGGTIEGDFEGLPAPLVLAEPVGSVDALRSLIRGVDYRWRLDALVALDDYVS